MSNPADFNVRLTVRNARLLRAIREKFETSAQCTRVTGIHPSHLSALMTMRLSPTMPSSGEWRQVAIDLAGWLSVDPEDLWPEHMRGKTLKKATAELELSAEQVAALVAPAEDPADTLERHDTVRHLLACLEPRQRDIMEALMDGATMDEVARERGVSKSRIWQAEQRAIKRMRAHAKAMHLLPLR